MNPKLVSKGKFLSLILRHCPEQANITLDSNGWTLVSDLLQKTNITKTELDEIIATNNKKRFEYSSDGTSIRACQGHSVQIDLGLVPQTPPNVLYHGTSIANLDSIMKTGLNKIKRTHVHLSSTINDAIKVGARHGTPAVVVVDSKQMNADGVIFYKSNNEVWLTDFVDAKYLKKL